MNLYDHTFQLSSRELHLFRWRSPELWASDLFAAAGIDDGHVRLIEENGNSTRLRLIASESALRLVLVALNLHAEQAPDDSTPAREATKLEQTLAGMPWRPTLTVGQLISALSRYQPERPVAVRCEGDIYNLTGVDDLDDRSLALELLANGGFDTRESL